MEQERKTEGAEELSEKIGAGNPPEGLSCSKKPANGGKQGRKRLLMVCAAAAAVLLLAASVGMGIYLDKKNSASGLTDQMRKAFQTGSLASQPPGVSAAGSSVSSVSASSLLPSSTNSSPAVRTGVSWSFCLREAPLSDAQASDAGLFPQGSQTYTRLLTTKEDLAAISRLGLVRDDGKPVSVDGTDMSRQNILLCLKNTNGNYGDYGRYMAYSGQQLPDPMVGLENAGQGDPQRIRTIQITAWELAGSSGDSVLKGFLFYLPKTAADAAVTVETRQLSRETLKDTPMTVSKAQAVAAAREVLRAQGAGDVPVFPYPEIENRYFLDQWDDASQGNPYGKVTQAELIRVWRVHTEIDGGSRMDIYVDGATGAVLCRHGSGE